MEKYLVLKGCAGLGNRLITLMSAIKYASETNRKIYVDWTDGMFAEKFTNAFQKYFDLDNVKIATHDEIVKAYYNGGTVFPKSASEKDFSGRLYDDWEIVGSYIAKRVPLYRWFITERICRHKLGYLFGAQVWRMRKTIKSQSWLTNLMHMHDGNSFPLGASLSYTLQEDIVLYADFRPYIDASNLSNYIKLKRAFYIRIKDFAERYDLFNTAIGLHIRATDKKPGGKLDKVLNRIKKLLDEDRSLNLFLSTDNVEICKDLQNKYEGRIIIYPKYLPNDVGNRGIHHYAWKSCDTNLIERMFEESLIDMWLLSMCKILCWQGNSSFSYISKILKNDPSKTFNWMGHNFLSSIQKSI